MLSTFIIPFDIWKQVMRDASQNRLLDYFITSLAKEVMFLVALVSLFVCLFVCLSVDNITQKVMNGLG